MNTVKITEIEFELRKLKMKNQNLQMSRELELY